MKNEQVSINTPAVIYDGQKKRSGRIVAVNGSEVTIKRPGVNGETVKGSFVRYAEGWSL